MRFRRQESSSEHLDVVSSAGVAFERLRSVSSTGRHGRPGAVSLTGIVFTAFLSGYTAFPRQGSHFERLRSVQGGTH